MGDRREQRTGKREDSERQRSEPEQHGAFMGMLQAIAAPPSLRLYHEVSVLQAGDAHFEYINCHPGTGLLAID